jgi:uncharacterized integral membrane protein
MKKVKIILIILIFSLAVVVSFQNKQEVETKFLFTSVTMPRMLLLLVTFTLGFFVGLTTASVLRRKSSKAKGKI